MDNGKLAKTVLDGLKSCYPLVPEQGGIPCGKCPYHEVCDPDGGMASRPTVMLPAAMISDIYTLCENVLKGGKGRECKPAGASARARP